MLQIRTATPADREAILRLSARSTSTPRTPATWDGNPLRAVLAVDDGTPVGMLPLEERWLEIGAGERLRVLWATGVHVDDAYRSQGVGGRLDAFAADAFAGTFDAMCVFREDETSRAYAWYRRNGFVPLAAIPAYRLDLAAAADVPVDAAFAVEVIATRDGFRRAGEELARCFHDHQAGFGGFRTREPGFWLNVWDHHYYRDHYRYSILLVRRGASLAGYALLGETDMRDGVPRYDLLEFVAPPDAAAGALHAAVCRQARQAGLADLRMQFAAGDPRLDWFRELGYVYRDRSTNIMGKVIAPARILARRPPRPAACWTWRTPGFGHVTGSGGQAECLVEAADDAFTAFCFRRLDADVAGGLRWQWQGVADGGNPFPGQAAATWRYFQVDYV